MRRARFYEEAIFPIRSINGVWWMLGGRIRLLPTRSCLVGSVGSRHHRPALLNDRRLVIDRSCRSLTFRIGFRR